MGGSRGCYLHHLCLGRFRSNSLYCSVCFHLISLLLRFVLGHSNLAHFVSLKPETVCVGGRAGGAVWALLEIQVSRSVQKLRGILTGCEIPGLSLYHLLF